MCLSRVLTAFNGTCLFHFYSFCLQYLKRIFFLILIGNLLFLFTYSCAGAAFASEVLSPEQYMKQGFEYFQRGLFEKAILNWKESARLYEKEGEFSKQSEALTLLAQAYQSVGQYGEALKSLKTAQVLAEKSGDRLRIASVLGNLGNLYIAIGPVDKAQEYLDKGLAIARELNNYNLSAIILNNLGNLFTTQKKFSEAIDAYKESMALAKKIGNHPLYARVLTNAAMTSLQKDQYSESKAFLDMALDEIQNLEHSHEKAYGLINIGLTYHNLCFHLPDDKTILLRLSLQTFNEAIVVAKTIDDLRAESYACGYLGKLLEDEKKYQEALKMTRRAIFAAQQLNALESLYLWQWQTGRLFRAIGKIDDAISAYRNAVYTLQSIRQEMSFCYGNHPIIIP